MPLDVSEEASQLRLTGMLMMLMQPAAGGLSYLPAATSSFDGRAACQGQPLSHLLTTLMCRLFTELPGNPGNDYSIAFVRDAE